MKQRTKTCTCCGETKPREAFYLNRKSSDYLRDECAACWDAMGNLSAADLALIRRLDAHREAEIARINEQLGHDALAVKFGVHEATIRLALRAPH